VPRPGEQQLCGRQDLQRQIPQGVCACNLMLLMLITLAVFSVIAVIVVVTVVDVIDIANISHFTLLSCC